MTINDIYTTLVNVDNDSDQSSASSLPSSTDTRLDLAAEMSHPSPNTKRTHSHIPDLTSHHTHRNSNSFLAFPTSSHDHDDIVQQHSYDGDDEHESSSKASPSATNTGSPSTARHSKPSLPGSRTIRRKKSSFNLHHVYINGGSFPPLQLSTAALNFKL
ncbi:hypothetical protein C8Q75DRAFT_622940 [Abortiporus biennis]|nr:hypothetical protein C8Q75DRAFT_622940 [Abortiporus biennis]